MIDFLSITINIKHEPFGSMRIKQSEDGELKTKQYSKTLRINQVPLWVTSMNDGAEINIRCCPLKLLQAHNVFGSNSLKKLWQIIVNEVLAQLDIEVSAAKLRKWKRGEFQIDEIHLTHRFRIKKYSMIPKLIHHILKYSSMSLKPSLLRKGVGVSLLAPHGLAEWLFYDKHLEFADKRTKEQKYLQDVVGDRDEIAKNRLLKTASKSIRAELKLGKKYLSKNELYLAKHWTKAKVIEVFTNELGLLKLGQIPALQELPETYSKIEDPKLRTTLILWGAGEDLTQQYGRTKLQEHRSAIKGKLGIDILTDQPALEPSSINLSEVFDKTNMLSGIPVWTRNFPKLAFGCR